MARTKILISFLLKISKKNIYFHNSIAQRHKNSIYDFYFYIVILKMNHFHSIYVAATLFGNLDCALRFSCNNLFTNLNLLSRKSLLSHKLFNS